MSFPHYQKYKNSDVAWLGEVPEHWGICKVRYLFEIKKRIAGEEGHDVLSITQRGIKVKDIESGDGQLSMDYAKYQFVEVGDFAMNHMDLLTGYVDVASTKGVTSPDYRVFSIKNTKACDSRYYLYLFQMGYQNKIFYAYGQGASQLGRWRLPTDEFNNLEFPLPDLSEQKSIAAFLDRETVKIDALVVEQERLIELLKEKRQAVISHAVTKGLNPNAPMKPSGIDWLGDIPAHWEVKPLKYNVRLQTEKAEQDTFSVGLENIEGWTGKFIDTQAKFEGAGIAFVKGDILFGKLRPYLAKIYLAEFSGAAVGDFHVLRPNNHMDGRYALYQMLNRQFIDIVNSSTYGSKMPRASWDFVGMLNLPTPPKDEQIQIHKYLDFKLVDFDDLEIQAQKAIDLLQERRTALISAAVMGKIDVRGVVDDNAAIPANDNSQQAAVFAEIVNSLARNGRRHGQISQMKGTFLVEAHLGYADGVKDYEQHAAGPYSKTVMDHGNATGIENGWFVIEKDGKADRYRPGKNQGAHFLQAFKPEETQEIKSLCGLLNNLSNEALEICATLYHCWLIRLNKGLEVTENLLVADFENYSPRKKKFEKAQIRDGLQWMKQKNITPEHKKPYRGYADVISKNDKQSSLFGDIAK